MNKFTISLLSLLTLSAYANIKKFDFKADHTFTLYSKGHGKYVEYKNTRLSKGLLNIDLDVSGTKESHVVKLGLKDFRNDDNLLKAEGLKNNNVVALDYAKGQTKVRLGSSSNLNNQMRNLIQSNLKKTLRSIDGDIKLSDFQTRINNESIKCDKSRNYLVCNMTAQLKGERVESNSKLGELVGHLFDLKKEMKSNSSTNYDIEGYREFLTKAEKILDKSLKSSSKKQKRVKDSLMIVKDLLINERIDSYEYTAIRSQSIVNFVDILLTKIKSLNA